MESPHIVLQIDAEVVVPIVQFHPVKFPMQLPSHPFRAGKGPASQVSLPYENPSPHIGLQMLGAEIQSQ